MRILFVLTILSIITGFCLGQDVINAYTDKQTHPPEEVNNFNVNHPFTHQTYFPNQVMTYDGEYEICLTNFFWWNDFSSQFALSFQYEAVSFPFTTDCAFTGGCGFVCNPNPPNYTDDRKLFMPGSSSVYNPATHTWQCNPAITGAVLHGRTPLRKFLGAYSSSSSNPGHTLVSNAFRIAPPNVDYGRIILPHSAIKYTINLHCGNSINDPIINSFSYVYDNTRGRMRYYPFYEDNCYGATLSGLHDQLFMPQLLVNNIYDQYDSFAPLDLILPGDGTLNYFPFNEISSSNCSSVSLPSTYNIFFDINMTNYTFNYIFPSPRTLITSPLRQNRGKVIAGYQYIAPDLQLLSSNPLVKHQYNIDQNVDLSKINPLEKVIYNPSEANITAGNLVFPTDYTFKTIRGIYPSETDAGADNLPENGGPFADLRDVPVTTDLFSENPADPTNDHDYASRYYLKPGSKLTVQPCVGLFDATIDAQPGSTLVFEDYTQVRGREHHTFYSGNYNGRFKIRGVGGAILRNYANVQYVQNGNITQPTSLNYIALGSIIAGNDVDPDPDQPDGDYVVQANADVTFTAGNNIYLQPGFSVQGGNFHGHIDENIAVPTPCAPISSQGNPNRFSPSTAVNYNKDSFHVNVFPNPNNGSFTVSSTHPLRSFTITDLTGRLILKKENLSFPSLQIALPEKVSGILLVQVTGQEGEMRMEKLVVR